MRISLASMLTGARSAIGCLGLALLSATAVPALAANVLVNPGFETGLLAPWTNSNDFCGGCLWSVDDADAHSGTFSAFVSGNRLILQTFAPVPVASITAASFWARHPNSADGAAIAIFFQYSDATTVEVIEATDGSAWTFFDFLAELDPAKILTGFGVYGNSGAFARFDDALLNVGLRVPEPSTWLLMMAGATWIVLRRRRRS
jgi:PEP-CTERM motif